MITVRASSSTAERAEPETAGPRAAALRTTGRAASDAASGRTRVLTVAAPGRR